MLGMQCWIDFVANFIRFPAVQNIWKSVKIWQSYREFKGGNVFWDTVYFQRLWNLMATINGLYLRNETWYTYIGQVRWKVQDIWYIVSKRHDYSPQAAWNWTSILMNPPQIMHSTLLSGFADGDQQMELNQTVPNAGQ